MVSAKVHGLPPGFVPEVWTREDLEQLAADLRRSLVRRQEEQAERGEEAEHRRRIAEEEQLLRQTEKKLSGS